MASVGPVNSQGGAREADDGDEPTIKLRRRGNSPAAAQQETFAPGGRPPPARQAGEHTRSTFRHPRHARPAPASARPGSPSYEDLEKPTYSAATLDYLVSLADDANRSAASQVLHGNRGWLEQRDYRAIDIQLLMARADLPEIMSALRTHDKTLRDAGFTSTTIVEAARHEAGARSIDALAARHRMLIEQLGYTPAQLSRHAFFFGPELIELLADCPQLTREMDGPLGIGLLISQLDDGSPERMLGKLRERASLLAGKPAADS